jgi:threonine dehydrogenase-like Zn-dependent dehydrogenase
VKYTKIVWTGPLQVGLAQGEIDEKNIGPHGILIKTHYSIVSAGTDVAGLKVQQVTSDAGFCAAVGEVVAIGSEVEIFKVGDLLYHYSNHAEYTRQTDNDLLLKVPEGLDERIATFARPAAISMTALRVGEIELGDFVGVTGLGAVGNFAAQLAGLQGAKVIAIDVIKKRLDVAKECGVPYCIDASKPDYKDQVMEITEGAGVSTLIESAGSSKVIHDNLSLIGDRGEIILLGSPREEYQCNLTEVLNFCHLCPKLINFKGAHEWRYPLKPNGVEKHSFLRNKKIIFGLMQEGKLIVKPLMTHVLPPEDGQKAYEGLANHKDQFVSVLFDFTKK